MRRTLMIVALTALLGLLPRAALACPVCFGDASDPMAYAANRAILAMIILVAAMLAAFATFFIYLMRRARLAGETIQTGEETASC